MPCLSDSGSRETVLSTEACGSKKNRALLMTGVAAEQLGGRFLVSIPVSIGAQRELPVITPPGR